MDPENEHTDGQKEKEREHTHTESVEKLNAALKMTKTITYLSLAIGIIAIGIALFAILRTPSHVVTPIATTTISNSTPANLTGPIVVNGSPIVPPLSRASAPVITSQGSFGSRLTNINAPFNATELAVINNAPDSYFEKAGEMFLNHSLTNEVGLPSVSTAPELIVNGKPAVLYVGSISCIYCGENRWAMALALSRFGNFTNLFKGYSSFGDGDLPTIYWSPDAYNTTANVTFGNFYQSKYLTFITMEYDSKIVQGFEVQPPSYFLSKANATGNNVYITAAEYFNKVVNPSSFGTPFTVWGKYPVMGADAVDFGNTMPTQANSTLGLEYMTHADVLNSLSSFNSEFAWTEYAGADIYISLACSSLNNTAPICSLPAIKGIEKALNLSG